MIIRTYIEPPLENNNYLIIDETTGEAALIDCSGPENENILSELKKQNATLKYILLTHGHFDHITGLSNYPNIKVLMHEGDINWIEKVNEYLPMFGMQEIAPPKISEYIRDNDIINLGNTQIKVIHTPGHTQGGVCFYVDGNLFSGDTIFKESVGRCDLEGGNFEQIVDSIKTKIFTLPAHTKIYPGHGSTTTVEWEKTHNRFF